MSSATTTLRMVLLGEDKSAGRALKGVGDEAEKSGKKMQTFHKVGTAAGVALAGGLALAGKAAFDMTKKAAEDQQAASLLAQTLHHAAGATDAQVASTEKWITAQGKAFGVADDDLRPALSRLAVATGSVSKAQRLAKLAMDVSAGSGKSLAQVSTALAKAQNGNVAGLARLGIKTKDSVKDSAALERAQTGVKTAQLAYNKAVAQYGAHSAQASIASDKLTQAHEKVGEATSKVKQVTISAGEAYKRLGAAYGGAASKNAETAAGKQKIMAVQLQELQEQIGTALIPVMSRLVDVGLRVVNWISNNTRTAGILIGVVGGLAAALFLASTAIKVYNTVAGIYAIRTAAQTEGTLAYAVAQRASAVASKVAAAGQWLLNAAMDANPIGLVVIAIAALVAGLVIAYKKSETFRNIVNGAFHAVAASAEAAFNWIKGHWQLLFAILGGPIGLATVLIVRNFDKVMAAVHAVGKAATWLWNNAFQPALRFIVTGISVLVGVWGKMLSALGHVPGFGWAKDAGAALQAASDKARALADNIAKIPSHKNSTVVLNVVHNVVHTTGGHVPAMAEGGIVSRATTALIGEAGPEAVIPLSSGRGRAALGGLGGTTIVVNANGLVDPQQMAARIQTELVRLKRQRGGSPLGLA